jgi:hypothetical protein
VTAAPPAPAPDPPAAAPDTRRLAPWLAGGVVFALLATLNSGGYRYGVGDQAAYIPQILHALDGTLFPRDAALLGGQSRLFLFDKLLAAVMAVMPVGLETWFLLLYLATLALLYTGLVRLGSRLFTSAWAVAALVLAETLRHRITRTGANTLEGSFHPRQLAFAIGVLGLGEILRGRPWLAAAAAVASGLVHPTTGLWFIGWIGVALFIEQPRLRITLGTAAVAGAVAGLAMIAGGVVSLDRMDEAWLATLAGKDYLFPNEWDAGPWLANLLSPVIIGVSFSARRARGRLRPGETGLVAGCLALVAVFAAALPLIAQHVALLVQLQVSRVFWMADLLATVYAIWWLADGSAAPTVGAAGAAAPPTAGRRARAVLVVAALAVLATVRGVYVLRVEHPGRPLLTPGLPADPWTDVGAWLQRHTPVGTHVLADPNHAWKFGTSLRVVAARDVFIENVKDEAMSMYDRRMARRLAERRLALGDFDRKTPAELQALAGRFGLDVVIAEHDLPLPELYRNPQFRVYRLTP